MKKWIIAVVFAIACGKGDDDGAVADQDGGADADVPDAFDPSTRFAASAEDLAVPDSGLSEGFNKRSSFAAFSYWTTIDLDGDRRPEIAQTGSNAQSQSVWDPSGSPYWKVFRGGDWTGSALEWSVPDSGLSDGFFGTDVTGSGQQWRTIDLTGDGLMDLVQTADPATSEVWDAEGDPHWKVFEGDGAGGFAATAITWSVPDSGAVGGFFMMASNGDWETVDVDGDGLPDLVQTSDPQTGWVWDAEGEPHWKVFKNTGDGFAAEAIQWSVPDSGTAGGFLAVRAINVGRWDLVDLDGDGKRDLVQTADPGTGLVWDASGEPYWKLFAGQAAGFASSPTQWPVPPSGLNEGFNLTASSASWRHWVLLDIDGDRDLDLVHTGDVSHEARVWDATGDPYWKVYRNQGDRFDSLYRWPVPDSGMPIGFFAVENSAWFTADVDGDRRPDLVETQDSATGFVWDAAGSPYWKAFLGQP